MGRKGESQRRQVRREEDSQRVAGRSFHRRALSSGSGERAPAGLANQSKLPVTPWKPCAACLNSQLNTRVVL